MDRKEQAVKYFTGGYNCSQSVLAAYCDLFGMDKETALKVSEGFGGGMGRMRGVCGTVSGIFMLIGLKYSNATAGDLENRQFIYQKVQDMAKAFSDKNGSYICGDLLNGISLTQGSRPTPRDENFYKKRPCVEYVKDACDFIEEYLID